MQYRPRIPLSLGDYYKNDVVLKHEIPIRKYTFAMHRSNFPPAAPAFVSLRFLHPTGPWSHNVAQNQDSRQSTWIIDNHRRGSLGKLSLRTMRYYDSSLAKVIFALLRVEISSLRLFIVFTHTCYALLYWESIHTPGQFLSFLSLNTKQSWHRINCILSAGNSTECRYADQRVCKNTNCNRWALWQGFVTILFTPTHCSIVT